MTCGGSEDEYIWARSMASSRCFQTEDGIVFYPCIDMFNHDPLCLEGLNLNITEEEVQIIATKP